MCYPRWIRTAEQKRKYDTLLQKEDLTKHNIRKQNIKN
jgi:hypothetical protein